FAARALALGAPVAPSDLFSLTADPPEAVRLSLGVFPTREGLERGLEVLRDLLLHPETPGSP
ncbi:MAG: PLP-dependent aminotransferase family protein, partial [Caulobacteraceae bacterium]